MSSFRVNLEDPPETKTASAPMFAASMVPARRRWGRAFGVVVGILLAIILVTLVGGYFYWKILERSPQYSLALLVDAAKRDDKQTIDRVVDINAVVDDFVPQVTTKAVELYGKGLPPQLVGQLAQLAAPIVPAVKDRARAQLPRIIRERVESFGNVPFPLMVIGAGRYLDIKVDGDIATVKSKIPEHPLELKMKRNGDVWQIVGVKDENLATDIAQRIGQEIITIAMNGGVENAPNTLRVDKLTDLLRRANELVK